MILETEYVCIPLLPPRPRPTPLNRQLKILARRKWCSSAWPTKAGWIPSSAPSLSCSHSAPKPEVTAKMRKKRKYKKQRWILLYSPTPSPLNFPHVSKIWGWICKASAEHKGVCSCDLRHWPLFFFFLLIKRLKKRLTLCEGMDPTPHPSRGHRHVKMKLAHWFKKKNGIRWTTEEEPQTPSHRRSHWHLVNCAS